ncbi:US12 family protein [Capnocytophaga genosp. AHN8471]|jgi:putative membrane protein|uniref:Bax inhibitor-1/YccA family protein n=1 Tax=Capnocytophaga genosp. AHN8471 TaxID=327574 RepID=UPI0019319724|nr:Bax inhibitor-1 family protein [Capnocytophaga genosp. AHN8471]MBM0657281.1 US12 family protein [Capnocytophaga genosp. AHN8471]MBM0658515.1 US12 family protein [Capnocytophaga genosp. AHN8471]
MSNNNYNLNNNSNSNNGYNLNFNNNYNTNYQNNNAPELVSYATNIEQATFYRKTYSHVAIALLAFIVVEAILINTVPESLIFSMVSSPFVWLFILGGFWLGSMLANKWTQAQDKSTQYRGLGIYVLLEAIIFLPMIYIAIDLSDDLAIISQAGIITLSLFAGLTAVVFLTRVDFSFLRTVLVVGGFLALGLIVAGALFNFDLGLWFSVAMVALAAGGILYETYNIKNVYSTDQYVAAALQLFSSVMLLFWYVLRILLSRRN